MTARRRRPGLEPDTSTMLLDDGVRDGQAKTGALADFLRREKRIEDFRLDLLGNAWTVVVDLEDDRLLLGIMPAAHHQDAAAVGRQHRLFGVDDEVEQHLLDLMAVGEDLR